MKQEKELQSHFAARLVLILTAGVFGIINTEMGVVGILPLIAERFQVTVPEAGWAVGVFALVVAVSAPVMPLLFSGINRRKVMLLALGVFTLSNVISMFTSSFAVLLLARALPAFLHPVYVSMAFTVAASSVGKEKAPKAVAKVFIGVSAGMVLGVPVTSYIVSETSFTIGMLFFAVVNALVFIATMLFVPSMPVKEKLPFGKQLGVLKKKITWYSILAVMLVNGALFGFFSYMSDFLQRVTEVSYMTISALLLVYGLANIVGNILAGRLLSAHAGRCIAAMPVCLLAVYVALFALGEWAVAMVAILFVLGVLAGVASNAMQYMLVRAAPEAPDFANGMFLTAANLGTTVGTALCGAFITSMGTRWAVTGACLLLLLSMIFIYSLLIKTKTI